MYRGESAVQQRILLGEPVDVDELLEDIAGPPGRRAALDPAHRPGIRSSQLAFIGRRICSIQPVMSGIRAAWIYSECETDATFDSVAFGGVPYSAARRIVGV